jgi:hypothetical protein
MEMGKGEEEFRITCRQTPLTEAKIKPDLPEKPVDKHSSCAHTVDAANTNHRKRKGG